LPAGRLREPLSGLRKAHLIFLTKAEEISSERKGLLLEDLANRLPGVPVVPVHSRLNFWDPSNTAAVGADKFKGLSVLAMSGIGHPGSFESLLERLGADVAALRFPDHHAFTFQERSQALERARRENRRLVVTEKDWQRLPPDFPCWVARLDWEPEAPPAVRGKGRGLSWIHVVDSVFS
jgi:tetraacyldisaccharide 4'-kinase